jgi:carbonic anhydrase/acetyltransferase-like protein (isoleucine patch superfamily)
MPIHPYRGVSPQVDATAYIAPGAFVIGDVHLGPDSSVWFGAVLRGDTSSVRVGARTNVQDGAVLHTDDGRPCEVGEDCTIGHLAVVHGCRIGRGSLVGMGAIVLTGADIGEESLVAAGAVVPADKAFPPRSLLIGHPVRRLRELTDEDVAGLIRPGVDRYVENARDYRDSGVTGP